MRIIPNIPGYMSTLMDQQRRQSEMDVVEFYIKFPCKPPTSLSFPVGKQSSSYRAELQALIKATQYQIETGEKDRSIVILTDSLSTLQAPSY